MGTAEWVAVGLFVMGGIFTVLWYLLQNKDAAQERELAQLWIKHDEDAKSLAELKLSIAEGYSKKHELEARFQKLEESMHQGFKEMSSKLDNISNTMLTHLQMERRAEIRDKQ
jgi:biopolymer transport protein ExbB/TolQ